MQVYRGMDIGTAKPSAAERAAVPHHLLDLVPPDETFTVARFVELADRVIASAAERRVPLIATGGTPMYYKALFDGLFDGPGADPAVRTRLGGIPNEVLARQLSEVDPAAAARIHVNDQKRLIRALEVYELTGQPISSFQTEWSDPKPRHRALWFGLQWEREALNRRINSRAKSMLASGWLEEARRLRADYGFLSMTAAEATGYGHLMKHLAGHWGLEESLEQIKIDTRQLARRQMKWFRRFPRVHWLAGDLSIEENTEAVLRLVFSEPRP